MKVVIVGCGRIGSGLANVLVRDGHEVIVIDRDARSFQRRLGSDFAGTKVIGDGLDEDVLVRAGVEQSDMLITLTEGDNRNIMIAQVAHEKFRVPRVMARIVDPLRAEAYRELGIDTVDQTTIMTEHMKRAVLGEPECPTSDAGE